MGHLVCAQEAHGALGLDRVVLMPLAEPTHRTLEDDPGAEVRAELCELAVEGDERLGVSRAEVDRGGPSYTVDTLRLLLEGEMAGDEITLIMGADQACKLGVWREPREVLSLARVAVAAREGVERGAGAGASRGARRGRPDRVLRHAADRHLVEHGAPACRVRLARSAISYRTA